MRKQNWLDETVPAIFVNYLFYMHNTILLLQYKIYYYSKFLNTVRQFIAI